jgi:nicotinamidase-related amidase
MAIAFDKTTTALLVMDMQNAIVHENSPLAQQMGFAQIVKESGVIPNIKSLLDACRQVKMPVFHIIVDFEVSKQFQVPKRGHFFHAIAHATELFKKGAWGFEIHEALQPLPDEPVVPKNFFSAFASSDLHERLREKGITDLILTGVATDFVVDSTCWNAVDLGYSVIVASNCCCTASQEEHEATLKKMTARADVVSGKEIVAAL